MTIHESRNMGGTSLTPSLAHSVVFEPVPLPSGDSIIFAPQSTFLSSPRPPHPITSIKDKPSDMGLKDITDKDSWIKAKEVIDSRLRCAPFWPCPTSKALVTMPDNVVASAWWEELLYFYLKPLVSDLFVEESRFDGKGFKMIEYIDKYFHPSGAVDSHRYIFYLIDTNQASDEPVVALKVQFSQVFASLAMGGLDIGSALQFSFMLHILLS
jgi:hypothetical protein